MDNHAESKKQAEIAECDAQIVRTAEQAFDENIGLPVIVHRAIEQKRQALTPSFEYALKQHFAEKNRWGWDSEKMQAAVDSILALADPFLSPIPREEEQ